MLSQQNFLLQCMMLHWMFLQQTIGNLIFIHISTQDITGQPTTIFKVLALHSTTKVGTITFTDPICTTHTSTTSDFIFTDMDTVMLMEDMIW